MKTIFVVDDDVKRISSYVEFLKQSGYAVILETDSTAVIPRFKEKKNEIDLIILDMMMPAEDQLKEETNYGRSTGLFLLIKIREISKEVPIMILTVVRDASLKEETTKYGATPYLEKPIMPSRLVEEIKKKIGK
jgi:CheY-like chemotaxis protein